MLYSEQSPHDYHLVTYLFMLFYSALAKSILIMVVCTLPLSSGFLYFIFALHYLCFCAFVASSEALLGKKKIIIIIKN